MAVPQLRARYGASMAMNKTNYHRDLVANYTRGTAPPALSSVFLGLFLTDPTVLGTGTEVAVAGYARELVTFGAPSPSGSIANSLVVTYSVATASWGTVAFLGLMTLVSGGSMLYFGPWDNFRVINADDQVQLNIGSLVIAET